MLEDHLTPRTALWAHIAAGVFVGTVAANLATWGAAAWMANMAARDAASTMHRATEQMKSEAQANKRAAAAAEADKRAQEASERASLAKQQEVEQAERERRELAWARFYKKPPACEEGRGGAWSVDCANDYMRARKRFSELYEAGRL